MSGSRHVTHRFLLDGVELLDAMYDEGADVMYLWRGDHPVEAISLTTEQGPVVRFDPDTGEIVGFTLLDWAALWERCESITITLPPLGEFQADDVEKRTHKLLASAIV